MKTLKVILSVFLFCMIASAESGKNEFSLYFGGGMSK